MTLPTHSTVLDSESTTNLTTLHVNKTGRLDLLRDVLGDDVLQQFAPSTIKAAVDGCYFLTPRNTKELHTLAELVAKANIPIARLGRGSVFSKIVSKYKEKHGP
jgi:hypothetical protein